MINSRDSYVEYNPNKMETIEVPYPIGTVLELKEKPSVLVRICQYRIELGQELKIGLNQSLDLLYNEITKNQRKFVAVDFSNSIDFEVTIDELFEKWQKTNRMVVSKIDYDEHKRTYTRMRIKK